MFNRLYNLGQGKSNTGNKPARTATTDNPYENPPSFASSPPHDPWAEKSQLVPHTTSTLQKEALLAKEGMLAPFSLCTYRKCRLQCTDSPPLLPVTVLTIV